jgi:hypothetical protein
MPMVIPAVMAAVTWVGGASAALTGILAAPMVGVLGEGGAIALAGGILKAGASLALGALTSALMAPKTGYGGSPTAFKADPSAPVRGMMGYAAAAGTQLHMRSWGKKNMMLSFVTALSLGPVQSFDTFTANGNLVTFPNPEGLALHIEPYQDKMWQTYNLGLPTEAALMPPTGRGTPAMEWSSAHKAQGHALVFWSMQNNSKRASYETGAPKPLWAGHWMKLWQPRFDSTYPGGSGPQRRDDWRTWGWTENAYDHALAWARGHFKLNADGSIDRSKRWAGIGAPDSAIDIAAFVEGANVSEANAWVISGEWTTADDKWSVLAAMLQAGGGVPLNRGAQISCMVNTPRASIYTYTEADLVGTANIKVMASRRDRFNTVTPRYREPAQQWEMVSAGAVTSSTYLAEDRNEARTREIEYSYVRKAKQAGELAAYDLVNARETLGANLPSKPHLLGLRAGDAFTIQVEELGLNGQKMLLMKRAFDPSTVIVNLDARSETDAKHLFALGQIANAPPTPSLTRPSATPAAPDPAAWTFTAETFTDGGVSVPALLFAGAVDDESAEAVIFEYRPVTVPESEWSGAGIEPPTSVRKEVSGVTPSAYDGAVSYRVRGVPGDRLILGPVTAGSIVIPADPGARTPVGRSVVYVTSATSSVISILAFDAYMDTGETISIPSGSISGMVSLTTYGVFWKAGTGFEAEVSPASTHMTTGNWIFIGWQATSDVGGSYPTPPTRPGGAGGTGPAQEFL